MKLKYAAGIFAIFFHFSIAGSAENLPGEIVSDLTQDERALIERSEKTPLRVGIIPDVYPMSITPPENEKFEGITVKLLESIAGKTGLRIEFIRIPIEKHTPVEFLRTGAVELVAGTLKIPRFVNDPGLVLSDRLFDATVSFISKKENVLHHFQDKPVVIAIPSGFQAGMDYVDARFSNYKYITLKSPEACFDALEKGRADFAVINKYIAAYQLQKPYFGGIDLMQTYSISQESCVIAEKGREVLISIINKGLKGITGNEHSNILMDFTIANPYRMSWNDVIYKYRNLIIGMMACIIVVSYLLMKLVSTRDMKNKIYYDHLTGLLSLFGFETEVRKLLRKSRRKLFIVDFQVLKFYEYNMAYGTASGDALLCHIAQTIREHTTKNGFVARIYAAHFVTLAFAENLPEMIGMVTKIGNVISTPKPDITVMLNFGIYQIDDSTLPVKTMIDRAVSARLSLLRQKGFSELYFAVFDNEMHRQSVEDSNMLAYMSTAIKNEEFYVVYQPKYDTHTETLRGAEALIRWKKQDGTIVMPFKYIELFEKNGQIISLDFYAVETVCRFLRRMMDSAITPVPVSVNFSRINLYDQNFVAKLIGLVEKYRIPPGLLEVELTESALIDDKKYVLPVMNRLREYGFSIALDDFGSGYSSLNSLKDLPISVLKLDREFFVYNEVKAKGQKIIKALLQLARSLEMQCVAEGVETKEQLDFLRACEGCDLVQGYYFSRPLDENIFVEKLKSLVRPTALGNL